TLLLYGPFSGAGISSINWRPGGTALSPLGGQSRLFSAETPVGVSGAQGLGGGWARQFRAGRSATGRADVVFMEGLAALYADRLYSGGDPDPGFWAQGAVVCDEAYGSADHGDQRLGL